MVVTMGQQYNVGEKPTVIMMLLLLLLFLTFSVLVANPKKTTLHDGQSRSWSAEQGKENKRKSMAAYPSLNHPHCSFREKQIK